MDEHHEHEHHQETSALLHRIESKVDLAGHLLYVIEERLRTMAQLLDTLLAKVKAQGDLTVSIDTALVGIRNLLKEAQTDPVKLQAAIDALDTQRAAIVSSIVANTGTLPPPDPITADSTAGTTWVSMTSVNGVGTFPGWKAGDEAIIDVPNDSTRNETFIVKSVDKPGNRLESQTALQFDHFANQGETVR